jgi:D-alanyl-D-alanine carboxypeptidase
MEKKPFALGTQGASLTLHRSDVDLYNSYADIGGSNVPVVAGETISQYQAMQGTLLASSDNLADSLAIWAFGSLAAYREYATQMVLRYGLHDTTIGLDASGLDPSTTSTAHDLALIATRALAQPVIASITRQATAELPIVGTIHNTNVLLGHSEVVGLKTGFTGEAGGVFILGATQSAATYTHTIITVVMGADVSRTAQEAAYTLYQSATRAFQYRRLIAKGEVVGWYEAPWQTRAAAISAQDVGVFVWPTRVPALSVHLEPAQPHSVGEKVGEARLVQGGSAAHTSPVVLQQAITSPDAWWRIATRPLW